ncbi:hypothetical protein D6C78_08696 [Aureobasidium pullulans]|uniref:Uncharacterized protein n=1 Tax=Aureobasidium pullulans TaxID=5580 RepID=A0A4V4LDE8_AURPU|nr:hypothetical protein D6C78_08696 [Aureobasidium pullulans]
MASWNPLPNSAHDLRSHLATFAVVVGISHMTNTPDTVVGWLSIAVTTVGLTTLISGFSAVTDMLDPFHDTRSMLYLGVWSQRQPQFPFYKIVKPPPLGPVLAAHREGGFCGLKTVHLSRVPQGQAGLAGWVVLLSVVHQEAIKTSRTSSADSELEKGVVEPEEGIELKDLDSGDWGDLKTTPLTRRGASACITLNRATLMTMLALTNARPVYHHSDAAGHRVAYGCYSGQWRIDWPLGGPAIIHFEAHDSHSAGTDVYPSSFERRVAPCMESMAGIVSSESNPTFKVAFSGRKRPGRYILKFVPKGFPGAHSGRHLYNMLGGRVYEVDWLRADLLQPHDPDPEDALKLILDSTETDKKVEMFVGKEEQKVLAQALDFFPWSSLSYSIHRGLRDILVAFSKSRMNRHRAELANILHNAVKQHATELETKGWESKFVSDYMADMAAAAVSAGKGDSGDSVRVVTDIAMCIAQTSDAKKLDVTEYWTSEREILGTMDVVALVKCFILEWSTDFDYQMYHDLPLTMEFA